MVQKQDVTNETDRDDDLTPEGASRRAVIGAATTLLGVAVATSANIAAAAKKKDKSPNAQPLQAGDKLMITSGKLKNQLLKPDMLKVAGRPLTAYPYDAENDILRKKYRLNRILVLKLDPGEMSEETKAASVEGVLAYSAVCTHKACTIKSWKEKQRHLRCHCHLSEYAALNKGKVMSGPAQTSLPLVPLTLDADGVVTAADGFNRSPGSKTT